MSETISRRTFLASLAATSAALAQESKTKRTAIIDSHVHLKHGDAAKTEYPARTIIEIMDKVGIDRSVVFAMSTSTSRSIEMAEQAVSQYPDRLIPYAYALPSYERPVLKELETALVAKHFRGIKIHASECTLADYVIDPVLKLAGHLGAPCLIDATGNVAAATRIANAFPDTNIIYAHMGRYNTTDPRLIDAFIKIADEHPRVLLDLSGVTLVDKIAEAVRKIGADKLVWGTDGPHPKPDLISFARDELDKVRNQPISQADKDKILGTNLARLLNW